MIAFVLALLAAEPTAAATSVPISAVPAASPIMVEHAAIIVERLSAPFLGDFMALVSNAGAPDELVSITTPASSQVTIRLRLRQAGAVVATDQAPYVIPSVISAGRETQLIVTADFEGMAEGAYWRTGLPVTLHFAHAGDITVTAQQVSPAPPPPPPVTR